MSRRFWAILNTILFTIFVPGTVAILIPRWLMGGYVRPLNDLWTWVGCLLFLCGSAIYLRCAWEFAVHGLGTPAPIAPTQFLVTTALHRYVRNPMYLGVALAIVGQAIIFRSLHVAEYALVMLLIAHFFVVLYEEPTLRLQFGESYEEYRRSVPRWIPKIRF
jgi:protein-S-isoprenylcysteine O-methyltransferase Ste14